MGEFRIKLEFERIDKTEYVKRSSVIIDAPNSKKAWRIFKKKHLEYLEAKDGRV